ncbi:hypothetical protein JOQ06_018513 [Pogonophryne albipinna]|nr:hypothetical protein JOQ06_018513 [Pogonophryne albipinna]
MHSACSMEYHWKQIDKEISLSPMPTEYQGATVKILCNDCQTHCTVPFHVLGMKCTGCGSYNTAQDGGLIQQQQGGEQQQQGEEQEEEEQQQEEEEEEQQQEEEEQEDIETDREPEQLPTPY